MLSILFIVSFTPKKQNFYDNEKSLESNQLLNNNAGIAIDPTSSSLNGSFDETSDHIILTQKNWASKLIFVDGQISLQIKKSAQDFSNLKHKFTTFMILENSLESDDLDII
jgi:hypothetical protein